MVILHAGQCLWIASSFKIRYKVKWPCLQEMIRIVREEWKMAVEKHPINTDQKAKWGARWSTLDHNIKYISMLCQGQLADWCGLVSISHLIFDSANVLTGLLIVFKDQYTCISNAEKTVYQNTALQLFEFGESEISFIHKWKSNHWIIRGSSQRTLQNRSITSRLRLDWIYFPPITLSQIKIRSGQLYETERTLMTTFIANWSST